MQNHTMEASAENMHSHSYKLDKMSANGSHGAL